MSQEFDLNTNINKHYNFFNYPNSFFKVNEHIDDNLKLSSIFNDSQMILFFKIYNMILKNKKVFTPDDISNYNSDLYHKWILLLAILYEKQNLFDNIEYCNIQLIEHTKIYSDFSFKGLKFLHPPNYVYYKSLEIGKFDPYISV